jgi:hypothetical protein
MSRDNLKPGVTYVTTDGARFRLRGTWSNRERKVLILRDANYDLIEADPDDFARRVVGISESLPWGRSS